MTEALTFDDVVLVPRYSHIQSRFPTRFGGEISLATDLCRGHRIDIPIIPANMDTVTEFNMARACMDIGTCAPIHRFMPIEKHASLLKALKSLNYTLPVIGNVGVGEKEVERAHALAKFCDIFLIDIAHGHSYLMCEMIQTLRELYPNHAIIAGNVCTAAATNDLEVWGADAVKVGVGPGSACTTRVNTGNGYPQLSAIMSCAAVATVPIIADGGIRAPGDIVKALAAGASSVMLGGMLAGCYETPGEVIEVDGKCVKSFRGMASKQAQDDYFGYTKSEEGISFTVEAKERVSVVIDGILRGVYSGMSYQGARTIPKLYNNAKFVRQTTAGIKEGG